MEKEITFKKIDAIQRIKLLPAANRKPISVQRSSSLNKALTLMMIHNFSQIPVIESRTVHGFISWETVGFAKSNGCSSEIVKDYIKKDVPLLDYEEPLLVAVEKIIEKDFALVKKNGAITGIVTLADISEQFIIGTAPFLIIEQIENHIRNLLNGKFAVDELRNYCDDSEKKDKIEKVDDLTFGNYVRIIENRKNWERLNLSIERVPFVNQLNRVREIRNSVMHFNPDGIKAEQRTDLIKMSNFLSRLTSMY